MPSKPSIIFGVVLVLLATSACHWPQNPAAHGKVPAQPQRIVTVAPQIFEDVVSLGILPVGAYLPMADQVLMPRSAWRAIAPLSAPADVEQVLSLHPDLILTIHNDQITALEQIAPVISIPNFTNFSDWRARHRHVAQVVGRVPEAEAAIADTERKISQVRRDFEGHSFRILMGYVSSTTRSMVIFPKNQNTAHLIQAIGLTYGSLAHRKIEDGHGTTLSWETVDDMQCDAFFVTPAAFENADILEEKAAQLSLLRHQPLWNRLSFVKSNRVFLMQSYWQMVTPVNADRILEDLERFLLHRDLDHEWKLQLPVTGPQTLPR